MFIFDPVDDDDFNAINVYYTLYMNFTEYIYFLNL